MKIKMEINIKRRLAWAVGLIIGLVIGICCMLLFCDELTSILTKPALPAVIGPTTALLINLWLYSPRWVTTNEH